MNSPSGKIREEIARAGPMSLARFMELALYAPEGGYYEGAREIGRGGDFFTSVSVGAVFGELLAFQFAGWLEELDAGPAGRWQLVEAGAHDGRLARDILGWLRRWRPEVFARVEYGVIEPSAARRGRQQETLGREFANVRWWEGMGDPGLRGVRGIIFSNELLDAMPAHRLGWDAGGQKWLEWRVGQGRDGLVWERGRLSAELSGCLPEVAPELGRVLPDGFTVEVSPAALRWWGEAARVLQEGKLLTVDYGLEDDEWLRPERAEGTLRAYARHHVGHEALATPGEQDITAHVNFSAVRRAGEGAGLRTDGLWRQAKFLTEIFGRTEAGGFEPWSAARVKQFQTLTHPEHLGDRFRVLVQSRAL